MELAGKVDRQAGRKEGRKKKRISPVKKKQNIIKATL